GDIAVADEHLRVRAHGVELEQRQHLNAAVPAAHAEDASNGWIGPGVHERRRSLGRITGDEPASRENAIVEHRLETERSHLLHAAIELLARKRARGCENRDAIPGAQRAGPPAWLLRPLATHAHRAISSATAWCSTRPTACRTARGSTFCRRR